MDRVRDEPHKLSGRAKDMDSAAVFLSLMMAMVVWSAIAVERFLPGFRLY
ncbi:MAG: diacylglycerol kinase [Candidatus Sedimenticola sp. 6PFRAG7]